MTDKQKWMLAFGVAAAALVVALVLLHNREHGAAPAANATIAPAA